MSRLVSRALLAAAAGIAGCSDGAGPVSSYRLAAQGVYAGALSGDSALAVVGSLNHGGSLWRTGDHARLFDWNHRQDGYSDLVAAEFSPDGTRAVTAGPRTLVVWDTASGEALTYWTTPGTTLDVALAPDGRRVLMGLTDHSAVLFDAQSGDHLHTLLHDGVVGSVALSADGRWALTGSDDASAVLWNTDTGDRVHELRHDNPVRVVALSAAGRYAFTASQGERISLWSGATGERLAVLADRNAGVTSARFSADENRLLVGYVNRTVELWDLPSGRRLERWNASPGAAWRRAGAAVLAVGFSASPGAFYVLSGDGRLVELRRS